MAAVIVCISLQESKMMAQNIKPGLNAVHVSLTHSESESEAME